MVVTILPYYEIESEDDNRYSSDQTSRVRPRKMRKNGLANERLVDLNVRRIRKKYRQKISSEVSSNCSTIRGSHSEDRNGMTIMNREQHPDRATKLPIQMTFHPHCSNMGDEILSQFFFDLFACIWEKTVSDNWREPVIVLCFTFVFKDEGDVTCVLQIDKALTSNNLNTGVFQTFQPCDENPVNLEHADDIVLVFEEETKAQVFLDELTKVIPSCSMHSVPTKSVNLTGMTRLCGKEISVVYVNVLPKADFKYGDVGCYEGIYEYSRPLRAEDIRPFGCNTALMPSFHATRRKHVD
ncbi:hypothetical protein CLF_105085 [Clonorchis sinensis]|uniref:Uncharacterized protein n=1 Tax=Clonorchis sinensis TaxID=79923 RepID=G7YP35_CLOSI|nr:hypothetical protein CLF_105085 [Clonorchis sinensis]